MLSVTQVQHSEYVASSSAEPKKTPDTQKLGRVQTIIAPSKHLCKGASPQQVQSNLLREASQLACRITVLNGDGKFMHTLPDGDNADPSKQPLASQLSEEKTANFLRSAITFDDNQLRSQILHPDDADNEMCSASKSSSHSGVENTMVHDWSNDVCRKYTYKMRNRPHWQVTYSHPCPHGNLEMEVSEPADIPTPPQMPSSALSKYVAAPKAIGVSFSPNSLAKTTTSLLGRKADPFLAELVSKVSKCHTENSLSRESIEQRVEQLRAERLATVEKHKKAERKAFRKQISDAKLGLACIGDEVGDHADDETTVDDELENLLSDDDDSSSTTTTESDSESDSDSYSCSSYSYEHATDSSEEGSDTAANDDQKYCESEDSQPRTTSCDSVHNSVDLSESESSGSYDEPSRDDASSNGPTGQYLFHLGSLSAKSVKVAGDFNQWRLSTALNMTKKGNAFVCLAKLQQGTYNYNFIVDEHDVVVDNAKQLSKNGECNVCTVHAFTEDESDSSSEECSDIVDEENTREENNEAETEEETSGEAVSDASNESDSLPGLVSCEDRDEVGVSQPCECSQSEEKNTVTGSTVMHSCADLMLAICEPEDEFVFFRQLQCPYVLQWANERRTAIHVFRRYYNNKSAGWIPYGKTSRTCFQLLATLRAHV